MNNLLKLLCILLSIVFVTLQYLDFEYYAFAAKVLALLCLTVLFFYKVKNKRKWFGLFICTFTLTEVLNFLTFDIDFRIEDRDPLFLILNSMYILSFFFLTLHFLRGIRPKFVWKNYRLYVYILTIMTIFSVISVVGIVGEALSELHYLMLSSYYSVIMVLLSVAVLNFLIIDDKKSITLLIGTLCLVFSEVAQITYYYITEFTEIRLIWSVLMVIAFALFYKQATMAGVAHQFKGLESLDTINEEESFTSAKVS